MELLNYLTIYWTNKMDKLYPLEKSPLYNLKSRKKLIKILGGNFTYAQLNNISSNTSTYYRCFTLTTNKGKQREVAQCFGELAKIQKQLQGLLRRIELPTYLYSKRLSSIKLNANHHKDNQYVFTIDLKNFYPSCSTERLASSLTYHFKQTGDVARLIAELLTMNGKIPQGSTTSANTAFISNKSMFDEIDSLCSEENMKFSVFVDDLTISSPTPINQDLRDKIIGIIRKNEMPISYKKIKFFKKNQPKHITGLVTLNGQVRMENKKYKKLFKELLPNTSNKNSAVGLYRYIRQTDRNLKINELENKIFN
jgi:RNA-directed DNA polymerase